MRHEPNYIRLLLGAFLVMRWRPPGVRRSIRRTTTDLETTRCRRHRPAAFISRRCRALRHSRSARRGRLRGPAASPAAPQSPAGRLAARQPTHPLRRHPHPCPRRFGSDSGERRGGRRSTTSLKRIKTAFLPNNSTRFASDLIKKQLKNLIQGKLIYLDAKHAIPSEGWPQIEKKVEQGL